MGSSDLKSTFERLIPQELKTTIRMQKNLVINLDSEAAAYPWELIQDTNVNDKPICVTAGMIRQLNQKTCLSKKSMEKNRVLIIVIRKVRTKYVSSIIWRSP